MSKGTCLCVGGIKGGIGKSTLAANMGYLLSSLGFKVILVDTDPQGSVMTWAEHRKDLADIDERVGMTICHHFGNLVPDLRAYANLYDFIIVDVAGRDGRELRTAMAVSDLLITPCETSYACLDTLSRLVDGTYKEISDINPNLQMTFVWNKVSTNIMIRDVHEYDLLLRRDFPEIHVLEARLLERKAYKDAWGYGLSIMEFDDTRGNKAREELINVTNGILNLLDIRLFENEVEA